jgi:hypothetical protein
VTPPATPNDDLGGGCELGILVQCPLAVANVRRATGGDPSSRVTSAPPGPAVSQATA